MREVDRLRDLGVTLLEHLAALGSHDLEQLGTARLKDVAGAVQDLRPPRGAERPPGRTRRCRCDDDLLQRIGIRQRVRPDRLVTERGRLHAGADGVAPGAVGGQARVGVRGVRERVARGRRLRGGAVLRAVGRGDVGGHRLDRRQEPIALTREQHWFVVELEHRRHEVVGRRAFFEPADQIGDRDVELCRVHDRRIEQQRADGAAYDGCLGGGHAQQHLELDAVGDLAAISEQPGEGDVEQVVTGDADAHVLHVVRAQRVVEHGLVRGIRRLLAAPGRERPVMGLGIHAFHRQVRAFDDAYLDRCAAIRHPGGRPLLQTDHGAEGIRQIRLQHDAGLERIELIAVEDRGEDRDRQVEVFELLHVEVDELPASGSGDPEQRDECVRGMTDGLVERPGAVRCDRGRHLDRDVVDVVAFEEASGSGQAPGGLLLAEDRLAEEVDVQLHAVARADAADRLAELGVGRVDDQVPHHAAQHAAADRHDDSGERGSERPAEADQAPQRGG